MQVLKRITALYEQVCAFSYSCQCLSKHRQCELQPVQSCKQKGSKIRKV